MMAERNRADRTLGRQVAPHSGPHRHVPSLRPRSLACCLLALVLAGLALAACSRPPVAVPPPEPTSTESAPYPAKPSVAARSAHVFADTVGINVHLSMDDTAAGNFAHSKVRLAELGVKHIRDGLCTGCSISHDRIASLGQMGIKSQLIIGWLAEGMPKVDANLWLIRAKLLRYVSGIEAPNEPDVNPGYSVEAMRKYQAGLWFRAKGNSQTKHIPVIGPTLVHRWNRQPLGDLSAYMDQGNMHPYPGGRPPLHNIADEKLSSTYISGWKPLTATEIGYHTDLTQTGHKPASERAIAMYTPRTYLEAFRHGVKRTFAYHLVDPFSEADRAARGWSTMENSFGLMRADWTPKPAFLALRNLLRVLKIRSWPVSSPGALRFGLEGAGPDVHHLLLRADDGSFALALWRNVSVWDPDARADLHPTPDQFEVVLGEPVSLAQRFDPVDSEVERRRWSYPRRIPVELGGAPVVLRLTPGA